MDKDCPKQNNLRTGRCSISGQIYLITTVTHNRIPFFRHWETGRHLVHEIRQLDQSNITQTLAWVIMPDHFHWLVQLRGHVNATLPHILNRIKGRTAKRANSSLQRTGAFWQAAYHDHALRKEEDLKHIARYIIANPLRAGLVKKIGDYPLWDCIWL